MDFQKHFTYAISAFSAFVIDDFSSARADVLSVLNKNREGELCVRRPSGDLAVDPVRLADALLRSEDITDYFLDRANPAGQSDGSVSAEEKIYAIASADAPFGSAGENTDRAFREAAARRDNLLMDLQGRLTARRIPGDIYELVTTSADPRGVLARDLFVAPDANYLRCADTDEAESVSQATSLPTLEGTAFFEGIILRGELDDLHVPRGKISEVETAKLSFQHSYVDGSEVFSADGVLGYQFGGFVPYVRVQHSDLDPDSSGEGDIFFVAPGFSLTSNILTDYFATSLTLNPTVIFDIENDAERFTVRGTAGPSFTVPGFDVPIFGGYINFLGPLSVRPDIEFITEGSILLGDEGDGGDIPDDYVGIGALASLDFRLTGLRALSATLISLDYRNIQTLIGESENIDRFEVAATVAAPDFPYVGLTLSYENGDNEETHQDEEFFKAALGVRF